MRHLCTGWLYMALIHGPLLFRTGSCHHASVPAIVAYMVVYNSIASYYGTIDVRIMNDGPVNIYYRSIIPEMIA
jgi:hypothetical protein